MKRSQLKRVFIMTMVAMMLFCSLFNISSTTVVAANESAVSFDSEESIEVADAKPWIEGDPAKIYQNDTSQGVQKVEMPEPSWFEALLIGLVKGIADLISAIELSVGLSPDQIIYGRVSPLTKGVNYYKFELTTGNPYGIVGAYVYGVIRTVCMVILWLIFVTQLLKYMIWSTSRTREEIKSSITKLLLCQVLMFIMPQIWHTIGYMFDIVLAILYQMQAGVIPTTPNIADTSSIEGIANALGATTNFSGGIMTVFQTMASTSLVGSILYLAVTILWIYFAYAYIGIALGMVIYFIFFPVVCVMSYLDKNVTGSWIKNVLQGFLVPIIDAILFMIPALVFYAMVASVNIIFTAIVTFLVCMLIIPARNTVKNLLGINVGGIGSLAHAGLGAIAMLQGARMLAKGVGRTVGHVREARDAGRRAKMMDELAAAEGGEGVGGEMPALESVGSDFGGGMSPVGFGDGGLGGPPPINSGGASNRFQSDGSTSFMSGDGAPLGTPEFYNIKASGIAMERSSIRGKLQVQKDNLARQESFMRDVEQQARDANGSDGLGTAIFEDVEGGSIKVGYSNMTAEQRAIYKEYALGAHAARNDISAYTAQSANLDRVHGIASHSEKIATQQIAQNRQAVIDKYGAYMINRPEFSKVSPKRQAELLREYSRRQAVRAVTSSIGGVVGAGAGFTGTVFYGPAMVATGIGGGVNIGSGVGSVAGEVQNILAESHPGMDRNSV